MQNMYRLFSLLSRTILCVFAEIQYFKLLYIFSCHTRTRHITLNEARMFTNLRSKTQTFLSHTFYHSSDEIPMAQLAIIVFSNRTPIAVCCAAGWVAKFVSEVRNENLISLTHRQLGTPRTQPRPGLLDSCLFNSAQSCFCWLECIANFFTDGMKFFRKSWLKYYPLLSFQPHFITVSSLRQW